MKKKRVLIITGTDAATDPRPHRMIHYLREDYQVTVVANGELHVNGVEFMNMRGEKVPQEERIPQAGENRCSSGNHYRSEWSRHLKSVRAARPEWVKRPVRILRNCASLGKWYAAKLPGCYEYMIQRNLQPFSGVLGHLKNMHFDLMIVHSLKDCPLAFEIAGKDTKIILDAREYYSRNYDDQWRWRLTEKPFLQFMARKYLPRCDKILTVSQGLAQEYAREYCIRQPEVFLSLPSYHSLLPSPVRDDSIRIIHHGIVSRSRRIEAMIEMMDHVDERFSLDFMLVNLDDIHGSSIRSMAEQRANVRIIPPVQFHEIIPYTNGYDIGLFLCPPSNFNLKYVLPNKLFEFIQARLAVAIGPSVEMKRIVEQYDCGVVSEDFSPRSLASKLCGLTKQELTYRKQQSHKAAQQLNAEANRKRIHEIVGELIGS